MALDPTSPIPLHYQIRQALAAAIRRGEWLPGAPIPSEPQLSARLGVSRMTVRQAIGELVAQGLLVRQRGRATRVAMLPVEQSLGRFYAFAYEMDRLGLEHTSRIERVGLVPAAQRLRLAAQPRLAPGPNTTGPQPQEYPIAGGAARALDAAADCELLAREGILGDEGGRATHEVGERSRHDGLLGGFGRGEQALPERASKRSPALGTLAEQANPHRGLLIAYRRR